MSVFPNGIDFLNQEAVQNQREFLKELTSQLDKLILHPQELADFTSALVEVMESDDPFETVNQLNPDQLRFLATLGCYGLSEALQQYQRLLLSRMN